MDLSYDEIIRRTADAVEFIKLSGDFLCSNPSNVDVRELYHNTRTWIEYTYDTLEALEKLRADGLDGPEIEKHRMQLCSMIQVFIIVTDDLVKAFDGHRQPKAPEDLM